MMKRFQLAIMVAAVAGCNLFQSTETVETPDTGVVDMSVGDMGRDSGVPLDVGKEPDTALPPDMTVCVPESDEDLCFALAKNCGALQVVDGCGEERTLECGTCALDDCGAVEANVCGCPCDVDGECRIPGEANPDASCLVCDPLVSATGWTPNEGADCDDGDACSATSACDAAGSCVPLDTEGCAAISTDCAVGVCDVSAMSCITEPVADGTSCTDDGLACTADSCESGACGHVLDPTFCLIDGACFAAGDRNPDNACEECDPGNPMAWSNSAMGSMCADGDGLGCTTGSCDGAGVCAPILSASRCLINGACYSNNGVNPGNDCQKCSPSNDPLGWSSQTAGTACADGDGLSCTAGACNATGSCVAQIDAASCVIGNACVANGDASASNDCRVCDTAQSKTAYSDVQDGTSCGAPLACQSGSCDGGTCILTLNADSCLIAGECFALGDLNPANPCQSCDPVTSTSNWTDRAVDSVCQATNPICTCNAALECVRSNGNAC